MRNLRREYVLKGKKKSLGRGEKLFYRRRISNFNIAIVSFNYCSISLFGHSIGPILGIIPKGRRCRIEPSCGDNTRADMDNRYLGRYYYCYWTIRILTANNKKKSNHRG